MKVRRAGSLTTYRLPMPSSFRAKPFSEEEKDQERGVPTLRGAFVGKGLTLKTGQTPVRRDLDP